MPILLGVAYLAGLYGLISLAHVAGQHKARREASFGGDFDPLFDPKEKSWWILLAWDGKKYRWVGPKWVNFSERLDWSMNQPLSYSVVSHWQWNGKKYVQDPTDARFDSRYGDSRVASR